MRVRTFSGREFKLVIDPCEKRDLVQNGPMVARLYMDAFSGAPWYEKYLVRINGKEVRMGSPEELANLERMLRDGSVKGDDVKPFYTTDSVLGTISRAVSSEGFIAAVAMDWTQRRLNRREYEDAFPVGVSWGMSAMKVPSEEKLESIERIIRSKALPEELVFYFDETFVGTAYRGLDVGKSLVQVRAAAVVDSGFEYAITRTMNPVQVGNLTGVFGSDRISEVYSNPEDMQPERRYYLIDLKDMRR